MRGNINAWLSWDAWCVSIGVVREPQMGSEGVCMVECRSGLLGFYQGCGSDRRIGQSRSDQRGRSDREVGQSGSDQQGGSGHQSSTCYYPGSESNP